MAANDRSNGTVTAGRIALACVAAALLASSGGCRGKLVNEERVIGGEYWPPTTTRSAIPSEDSARAESERVAAPSIVSLDRENWPMTTFSVPNALPAHRPVYHYDVHENLVTARSRGRFPTSDSVNQTTDWDAQREQVREAMFAPAIAALDIVLWLPRAAYKRPWFVSRSGLQGPNAGAYERAPMGDFGSMPEPVGEPMFPMTKNPPTWTPASTSPGAAPGDAAPTPVPPAGSPTTPAEPATPAVPAVPVPPAGAGAASEPEDPGQPATHIGVGDGMGRATSGQGGKPGSKQDNKQGGQR